MKITEIFSLGNAKQAMRKDPQSGLESSIKKWESIFDALQHISVAAHSHCGLCVQHKFECKSCPLAKVKKQGCWYAKSDYYKAAKAINEAWRRAEQMLLTLKLIRSKENEEK